MRGPLTILLVLLLAAGFLLLRGHEAPAPDDFDELARGVTGDPAAPDLRTETGAGDPARDSGASAPERRGPRPGTPYVVGLVVDELERPLPGASVHLETLAPQVFRGAAATSGEVLARTSAGPDGSFELPLAERRWVRVVASLTGRATVGVRVAGPGSSVRLVLPLAASLRVAVVDVRDTAVAGARVEAFAREAVHVAETDEAGHALFDALPPGSVSVQVAAAGGRRARTGPLVVLPGPVRTQTVLLSDAVTVRGVVLDAETELPIAGAEVHAAQPGLAFAAEPTGPDGAFGPVAAGGSGSRVTLAVRAAGYAPRMLRVLLPRSSGPHRLPPVRLTPTADWRGRVVDDAGRAVADARVAYTAAGIAGRTPPATRTDEEGRFTLPAPSPPAPGRRVVLTAEASAGSAALALRPGDAPAADLVLVLTGGHAVAGRVVSTSGEPVGAVAVRLEPRWSEIGDRREPGPETARLLALGETARLALTTTTDAQGWWRVDGVPDGAYDVRLLHDGTTDFADVPVQVAGSDADAGVARLGDGHAVVGTTTDEAGRPLAGVEVTLRELQGRPRLRHAVTDAEGGWRLTGLPAGTWILLTNRTDRMPVRLELEVPTTDPVDLVLGQAGRLTGRVLDAQGRPSTGAFQITAESEAHRGFGPGGVFRDRAGRFLLEGVPPGLWTVRASTSRGELGVTSTPVELRPGASLDVTITLAPGAVLAGSLSRAEGQPVAAGRVALRHEERGSTVTVTTSADGTFRLPGLDAGSWKVVAHGRRGAAVFETVDLAPGEKRTLDLVLGPVTRLDVTVRGEDGGVRAGAYVLVRPLSAPAPRPEVVPRTDRAGRVVLDDVPVGPVVLQARTRDGESGRAQVDAGAEREGAIEIRVRKTAPRERN